MDKKLEQLLTFTVENRTPRFEIADPNTGAVAMQASEGYKTSLEAIQEWMRSIGSSSRREDHEMVAAAVREPIRTLARYKAWTQIFFSPWTLGYGEDNRVTVDNPIGNAFMSSPEGRPMYVNVAMDTYPRPAFFEIAGGLEIQWGLLKTAGWNILQRRMEEAADAMALKLDVKGRSFLDTAIASVSGHRTAISGGVMTKAGLDTALKAAVQIGFPITQGAINPARLMDMTGWTNGSTSALPWHFAPEGVRDQIFRQLWADGYGNIRWFVSHSVPMNSIYLSGDPAEIGWHQDHGAAQSASDIDIDRRVDKHAFWEDHAFYVGNAYNLWELYIQP